MFRGPKGGSGLRVHGVRGELLWYYKPVAALGPWSITKVDGAWTLNAAVVRLDARLAALARRDTNPHAFGFTAPRHGGFWRFPIQGDVRLDAIGRVVVPLGMPEH